jgi:hypothetical protein
MSLDIGLILIGRNDDSGRPSRRGAAKVFTVGRVSGGLVGLAVRDESVTMSGDAGDRAVWGHPSAGITHTMDIEAPRLKLLSRRRQSPCECLICKASLGVSEGWRDAARFVTKHWTVAANMGERVLAPIAEEDVFDVFGRAFAHGLVVGGRIWARRRVGADDAYRLGRSTGYRAGFRAMRDDAMWVVWASITRLGLAWGIADALADLARGEGEPSEDGTVCQFTSPQLG